MTVQIDEAGAVVIGGTTVDYATAHDWCVDTPEKITDLVEDTDAFARVIAEAETARPQQREAAVREAFAAGRPKRPGPSWAA